jgi:hypothetical protein
MLGLAQPTLGEAMLGLAQPTLVDSEALGEGAWEPLASVAERLLEPAGEAERVNVREAVDLGLALRRVAPSYGTRRA